MWFHSSFHMLISVQYQVSLFHKPSGRLTSCISPDGLPYQPLTSMAPYLHDKSWNALLQCFYLGSMPQLMAWRLIVAHFIPQDWNQIWLPLGANSSGAQRNYVSDSSCAHPSASNHPIFLQFLFLLHPSSPRLVCSFITYALYKESPFFLSFYYNSSSHMIIGKYTLTHQKRTTQVWICVEDNMQLDYIL